MIRCLHSTFKTSKDDLNRLYACNKISALIWNKILDLSKFYRIITNGKWIKESDLKLLLKNIYPLHSQSVQNVIEKYIQNREDTLLANKKGFKNKYPWRYKNNFPTTWKTEAFNIKDNILYLSLARFNHKNQSKIKIILPKKTIKELKDKQIQQVELIYKYQLLLSFIYKLNDNNNVKKDNNIAGIDLQAMSERISALSVAGIDLGEIHSISTYTTNNKNCIITGRYLRSLRRLQDKNLGKLNHLLSRCKKNSKRYKRLKRTKRKMLIKTNNKIKDCNHKITNEFIKFVQNNDINKVVIGNVKGIEQNKNRGRKQNSRLSKWNYGEHIRQLRYKLDSLGVKVELVNESYTSQTCPCCGKRNKCKNRNYRCSCEYESHRDLHGARNILNKSIYGRIYTVGMKIEEIKKITYLRPLKKNVNVSLKRK